LPGSTWDNRPLVTPIRSAICGWTTLAAAQLGQALSSHSDEQLLLARRNSLLAADTHDVFGADVPPPYVAPHGWPPFSRARSFREIS